MKRYKGLAIAKEIMDKLHNSVERIEIAGSLRRHKEEVGDIELVVIPKFLEMRTLPNINKFDDAMKSLVDLKYFNRNRLNKNNKPLAFGERVYLVNHTKSGEKIDFFVVLPPADFGVIYTIRTGSRDFNIGFMTKIKRNNRKVAQGQLWDTSNSEEDLKIDCPEEEDFFKFAKLRYVEPRKRIGYNDAQEISE